MLASAYVSLVCSRKSSLIARRSHNSQFMYSYMYIQAAVNRSNCSRKFRFHFNAKMLSTLGDSSHRMCADKQEKPKEFY